MYKIIRHTECYQDNLRKSFFIMIENRKWFKGSRDRGLITFKFININTHNEENFKRNNLIKLITDNDDLKAS